MQTVNLKRSELLDVVRKNRDAHRAMFEEAQIGFRARVIERLDEMLKDAREGKRYHLSVGLSAPIDQTKEYDAVIRMLEMSVDDTVELHHNEFTNYVLDDWNWKAATMALNSTYIASSR